MYRKVNVKNPFEVFLDIGWRLFLRRGESPGIETFWGIGRKGRSLRWAHNILHNDGEEFISKLFTTATTIPTNLYIGLDDRSSLAESDALTTIAATEPSTGSYARATVALASAVTAELDGGTGDWQFRTNVFNFAPSGANWGTLSNAFLTTQASAQTGQFLLASRAFSAQRTINDGDDIDVSIIMRFREAA